jgi:hypothetical protein
MLAVFQPAKGAISMMEEAMTVRAFHGIERSVDLAGQTWHLSAVETLLATAHLTAALASSHFACCFWLYSCLRNCLHSVKSCSQKWHTLNVLWACEASEASIAAAFGTFLWPMTMTARIRVHADLAAGRHVVGVWLA